MVTPPFEPATAFRFWPEPNVEADPIVVEVPMEPTEENLAEDGDRLVAMNLASPKQ